MPATSRPGQARGEALFRHVGRAAALALTLLLLAACSQQQATITIDLDASTVELLRGAPETEVLVTITRTGNATGEVELSITGLPADVTATLSDTVLSGVNDSTTLTLNAPAEAVEGIHDLEITATVQGLTANASLQVQVVGLTVTGTIRALFTGPVAGLAVASQHDTAVTDSNGRFTLRGLSVPYDITAWSAPDRWLHEYRGLNESDVMLTAMYVPSGSPASRSTTVSGPLSGDAVPVGANQSVLVCLEGIYGIAAICDLVGPAESSFSINAQWFGSTTRSVRLHLLQVEKDGDGKPVAYLGYVSRELELKDGVPVLFIEPIDLGDALETTTVKVEIESLLPISQSVAAVRVGPDMTLPVMSLLDASTSYEVLMPVIPDASYTFLSSTNALESAGWATDVTGTEASVLIPASPTVTAPTSGATGVTTDTDFTISNPSGGPVTWLWSGPGYYLGLTSMATTVNLPDPSERGFSIPAAASSNVTVMVSAGPAVEAGARVLDDLANTLMLSGMSGSTGFAGTGWVTPASGPSFTTAP